MRIQTLAHMLGFGLLLAFPLGGCAGVEAAEPTAAYLVGDAGVPDDADPGDTAARTTETRQRERPQRERPERAGQPANPTLPGPVPSNPAFATDWCENTIPSDVAQWGSTMSPEDCRKRCAVLTSAGAGSGTWYYYPEDNACRDYATTGAELD